jgi:hypothetical protein
MAALTWMCEHGQHGTAERRREFTYSGSCAGVVRNLDGSSHDCPCHCHTAEQPKRYPVYVASLRQEAAEATAELAALYDGLDELASYLTSEKFAGWGYVNVADVLARLRDARGAAMQAAATADANRPGGHAA